MRLYFFLFLFPCCSIAQSNYAPLNEDYYNLIDRYEIESGRIVPEIFTVIKPYKRSAIIGYIDSLKKLEVFNSVADYFNYEYLSNDSWEWSSSAINDSQRPLLRHFYKKKSD